MDPITIIAAVGTTLKIMKEIWRGLQWMQQVYENYSKGDKTLRSIGLECNIYAESIKTIGQWLKKNQGAKGLVRQMRTTHNAITLVQVSMANVLLDLKKFQNHKGKSNLKDKDISQEKENLKLFQQYIVTRAKLQWFQETMRLHLVELRAHAATLHLTLGVIELTGSKLEPKEKIPAKLNEKTGKLEDKTGRLEKRLLLRQIITRALDLKRSEIAGPAGRGESEQSPKALSPLKLTFYDVVQLARQQALLEKAKMTSENLPVPALDHVSSAAAQSEVEPTHSLNQAPSSPMPSDDLIDLSDASEPTLCPRIDGNAQHDLDLLDVSRSMATHLSYPSLTAQTALKVHNPDLGPTGKGQDIVSLQRQSDEDLLGLIPSQASAIEDHKDRFEKTSMSAEALQPLKEDPFQSCEVSIDLHRDTETQPAAIELIDPEEFLIHDSDAEEASALHTSLMDASVAGHITASIDQGNDGYVPPVLPSPISTASPSIFSHSSTLTGATGCTFSGVTEDDMRARRNSVQNGPKLSPLNQNLVSSSATKITAELNKIPYSSAPVYRDCAEQCKSPCINSRPVLQSPSKSQQTLNEDSVSLSPPLPELSNLDEPDAQGFPWILRAAREGDDQLIRRLLKSGADIKAFHALTRRHSLSEAAMHGHQEIVDLLIEENCPVDFPDSEGNTALHHACQRGHLIIAKRLIASGAAINACGLKKQTALHLAMQVPHQSVVMLLILHQANVNARDASSLTPLHISASQGNKAMCEYLLNAGAQIDSREAHSKTPLEFACEEGHYELVQSMLNQSKLTPSNMTFLTAFFAAVEYGHVRTAECFFEHSLNLQELKQDLHKPAKLAVQSGCLAMIELMIRQGCDMNARDENGWDALHLASHHGHYQIVERLLATDMSAKAVTFRKETSLHFAVKAGHFAVAERLLRTDKNDKVLIAQDQDGQQAVHFAARDGTIEIFNLIISNGGKFNVENYFGWQPIHIATAYGHLDLVERLLQQGANIEEKLGPSSIKRDQTYRLVEEGYIAEARKPYPGSRPLHIACEYSRDQIAEFLISKGAKLEATCSEGWQPLHHAAYFGSPKLVDLLLQGGVNPHATTNEGKTAQAMQFCTSHASISEEEKERVRILLEEAVNTVRRQKQKSFKVSLKKGSTVEEKNNLFRATNFTTNLVSRPPLHRATKTAQVSNFPSDLATSQHRPRMQHFSHTSPLPLADSQVISDSSNPLAASSAASPLETITTDLPTTTESFAGNVVSEAWSEALKLTKPGVKNFASELSSLSHTVSGTAKSNLQHLTPEISSSATAAIGTAESIISGLASEASNKALTAVGAAETNVNDLTTEASATAFTAIGAVQSNLKGLASETSSEALTKIGATESTLKDLASEASSKALSKASSKALSKFGIPDPSPRWKDTTTQGSISSSHPEDETPTQLETRMKRRTTFGLSRAKTSVEIGKFGLGSIAKPAFELRKQTVDIGTKTLGLGMQGLEISKQGIEKSKQGLEIGKQGIEGAIQGFEVGKQSINFGKESYRKAKRFAIPGKADTSGQIGSPGKIGVPRKPAARWTGTRGNQRKSRVSIDENGDDRSNLGDNVVNTCVETATAEDKPNKNVERNKEEEADEDEDEDDAGSAFSLGEFADDGNDDF